MDKFLAVMVIIIIAICLGAAISLLTGFVFFLVWNWIAHGMFGAIKFTFWQAWGVMFLAQFVINLLKGGSK